MRKYSIFAENREENEYEVAAQEVRNFFSDVYASGKKKAIINDIKLVYRLGQVKFSRQIMNAIRYNQILVVQAGVGIGKTVGYLIPIFYSYKNAKKFKNVVISTSNIGLQQQLLTDINMVSNLLGINITPVIAKGANNYACLENITRVLNSSYTSDIEKNTIQNILQEMQQKDTIDKDELTQIEKEVWEKINLKNVSKCTHCLHSRHCLYSDIVKNMNHASLIVTNHNFLTKSILERAQWLHQTDLVVFDEAHKLEGAIRDIQGNVLDTNIISKTLLYYKDNLVDSFYKQDYIRQTISDINHFFSVLASRASKYYSKYSKEKNISIVECDKVPIFIRKTDEELSRIIERLSNIYDLVHNINIKHGYRNDYREEYLTKWIDIFQDMNKKDKSKNIYWANFLSKRYIEIGYTCRDTSNVMELLMRKNIPTVFTSGTLTGPDGDYSYFENSLGLKANVWHQSLTDGQVCISPYNYDKNSLFYYDSKISNPNDEHSKYLDELVVKISQLIKITNGRTLVLFTSKEDMNYVYQNIDKEQFQFEIMVQGGEDSNSKICTDFKNNVKSCLFATGAFWEGIDIKGRSLSQVIITRLPFAPVDAIMDSKGKYLEEQNPYIYDMIQKLAQGTGRLIRGMRDVGIVSCLDSRFKKYSDYIESVLPFENYTDKLENVCEFSNQYITNLDGPRGPYKKRTKKEDNK